MSEKPSYRPFLEFARDIYANSEEIKISDETSVPEKYKDAVNKYAEKFRDNAEILEKKNYHHIQDAFTGDIDAKIESVTGDGDIPDGILNTLAMNIYGGLYNNLVDTDSKAIINALSIYIILSSNSKEENSMNPNENDTVIQDPVDIITENVENVENVENNTSENVEVIDANLDSTNTKEEETIRKYDCIDETKGNIEALPYRLFSISEYEITRYLQNNVLHCPILPAFKLYEGIPGMPYVIMQVAIDAKYAVERVNIGNSIITDMVAQIGGDIRIKKSIVRDLEPFTFPKYIKDGSIYKMPEEREKLTKRGIVGDDLAKLVTFSNIRPSREGNRDYICIYLRPERIIADMLCSKKTCKPYGLLTIENVKGGTHHEDTRTTDPITWNVTLNCLVDPTSVNAYNVDIETIFRNAITD